MKRAGIIILLSLLSSWASEQDLPNHRRNSLIVDCTAEESRVDEEKEVVSNHVVRHVVMEEEKTTFTKEEILQILKEDSAMKLW